MPVVGAPLRPIRLENPSTRRSTVGVACSLVQVRCPQLVVSFKYDCEEASHRHVKMDGTCPQLFALFLELIYTGACCMDWVQLVPMYQLCDLLLLPVSLPLPLSLPRACGEGCGRARGIVVHCAVGC